MALDPGDVRRPGVELGHQFEDFHSMVLAWASSGMTCSGDGAGRVGVDDQGLVTVPSSSEPGNGSEDSRHLSVKGGLPGPKGLGSLGDRISFTVRVGRYDPAYPGGPPEGAISPGVGYSVVGPWALVYSVDINIGV